PVYLRSHPLTTERIADIQARTHNERYRQHLDSLDFHLMRARARVLQDASPQGLRDAAVAFDNQMRHADVREQAAVWYGRALIALHERAPDKAQERLDQALKIAGTESAALASMAIEIKL